MNEPDAEDKKTVATNREGDKKPVFDMYYFKSRIDVVLILVMVLVLIILTLLFFLASGPAGA